MNENEGIEEFLNRIFNLSDPERKIKEEINNAAQVAWMIHRAYIEAGFTIEQAFELVKLQISHRT